jgi:hypothetical protein
MRSRDFTQTLLIYFCSKHFLILRKQSSKDKCNFLQRCWWEPREIHFASHRYSLFITNIFVKAAQKPGRFSWNCILCIVITLLQFLGASQKCEKRWLLASSWLYVCMEKLCFHWTYFHETIHNKISIEKTQVWLKSVKNTEYCTWRPKQMCISLDSS